MKKKNPKKSTQLKVRTQLRGGISLKQIGDKAHTTVNHPAGLGTPDTSQLTTDGYSI